MTVFVLKCKIKFRNPQTVTKVMFVTVPYRTVPGTRKQIFGSALVSIQIGSVIYLNVIWTQELNQCGSKRLSRDPNTDQALSSY